jgi:hypothetical protein
VDKDFAVLADVQADGEVHTVTPFCVGSRCFENWCLIVFNLMPISRVSYRCYALSVRRVPTSSSPMRRL